MKKSKLSLIVCLALATSVLMSAPFALGIMSSADQLINLGLQPAVSRFVSRNLIGTDTSGNLVLPVASGKKLSITIAGTEVASVKAGGVPGVTFETVAGAGTTTSDAAALSTSKYVHQITGANGTVGWKFASLVAGDFHILMNTTAGVAKIYAPTGGTVNGGSTDAAFSALTGIKPIVCYASTTLALICS